MYIVDFPLCCSVSRIKTASWPIWRRNSLHEATHTITTLTDCLEGEGQVGAVRELEVKVQSLERVELERRKLVSGSHLICMK